MDRVITTTLYLADDETNSIVGRERDAPPAEVTFAWVSQLDPDNIPDISDALSFKPYRIQIDLAEFLDQIIRKGCFSPSILPFSIHPQNLPLIEKIVHAPIVIERSPPQAISISDLLKLGASPVALGTYVGSRRQLPAFAYRPGRHHHCGSCDRGDESHSQTARHRHSQIPAPIVTETEYATALCRRLNLRVSSACAADLPAERSGSTAAAPGNRSTMAIAYLAEDTFFPLT